MRKLSTREVEEATLGYNAEILWLLGQPHLDDYLDFVKHKVVGGDAADPARLADEWRAANDRYYELEETEAGIADRIECRPLSAAMRPLAKRLKQDPYYRETFDTFPTELMMVELDRLVVAQTHVATNFCGERARTLGPDPSPQALFDYCLPAARELPPVRIERLAHDRFRFSSESTDLRANPPKLIPGDRLGDVMGFGPVAAAAAVLVGFGSNFLVAIRSGTRLVLHNGYHRAYSLRSLGLTHVPCIVETVTRKDELRIAASETVSEDPEFYFAARRPPLLKDFFDPRLVRQHRMKRMETVVEVELKIRSTTATDC